MDRRGFLASTFCSMAGVVVSTTSCRAQMPAGPTPDKRTITEQLVMTETEDNLQQTGLVLPPSPDPARPVALIWVHGATANFYYPSYAVGRKLASMGYTFVLGNTRMHDIGCVLADNPDGSALRGGSLWGLPSKEVMDIRCLD